ncbi:MAG: hypothetical protein IT335_02005 [Thermomicrobiales bacterium]|nr:hypothetical protein [Thermomicrobiales bacterium]
MPSRGLTLFTVLLVAMASILAWESTRKLDQPVSVITMIGNRQVIRSYYSNLNAFLNTGEIEPLSSMFGSFGDGLVLPGCEQFERETRWRATHATYPDLTVWIRDEGVMGEESIVEVDLDSTYTLMPSWLPVAGYEAPDRAVEWFRTSEGAIVDYRSTMQSPLVLELTDDDMLIPLTRHSRLVIVRLEFAPDQRTYQRLPGPGLLLLTGGELELVPDPSHRLNLVRGDSGESAGAQQTLTVGDSVTGVGGVLVVRNSGTAPVSALYVSLQLAEESGGAVREAGTGGVQESVLSEGHALERALSGEAGTETHPSGVDVSILGAGEERVEAGSGALRVALVLTDQPPGEWPSVAVARVRGPLDADGRCPDERSLYIFATFVAEG